VEQTTIAGKTVPIQSGPTTIVYFSADCHPSDPSGEYEFWMETTVSKPITRRRPARRDPGERFQMMGGTPGYERYWAAAQAATLVRPASDEELLNWFNDPSRAHDALCAGKGTFGGSQCARSRWETSTFCSSR
jgi:hypothetical protein